MMNIFPGVSIGDLLYIYNHYGKDHQLKKLDEELDELKEALGIYTEVPSTAAWNHVVEEAGDVLNVLLELVVGGAINEFEITDSMIFKLSRQEDRILEEESEWELKEDES